MRILWALLGLTLAAPGFARFEVGDVILQPMRCYLCRLIEQHENSIYSHLGLVVQVSPEVLVAQSLGQVRLSKLSDFLTQADATRPQLLIRLKEQVNADLLADLLPWLGADYDHDFRWDNLGRDGREALYCSELVTKILNPYLTQKIPTKIMRYEQNHEAWERYFRGNIPEGLPGNSPGDFERSRLFEKLATFEDSQWTWN